MPSMFPSVPTYIVPPSARFSYQTHPTRTRTLSSPAFLHSLAESTPPSPPLPPAPAPQNLVQARQSPPIPLSLVFAHVPRSPLPVLGQVSKQFNAAAQLALYCTLEPSSDGVDACIARLPVAPHLAELFTTLERCSFPHSHGASFELALAVALRSMRAPSALTLPAFNSELLAAAPGAVTSLTLLANTLPANTLPYAFFDDFLAAPARARLTHLALPHFVGVPPAAHEVPSAAPPRPVVPLRHVTLRIASTRYDGLRPTALFNVLGGAWKELVLVLAPDVDVRTRGRLLGALANAGTGLEVFEISLEGTLDEVALQALYKQVGSLLPNVPALRRLKVSLATEIAVTEDAPSRLAL
ncbi:hypothetical protein V8E53_004569 [Lactarius tabidus]